MLAASATGFALQATGSYVLRFILAGLSYLFIPRLIHVMIPRIESISDQLSRAGT